MWIAFLSFFDCGSNYFNWQILKHAFLTQREKFESQLLPSSKDSFFFASCFLRQNLHFVIIKLSAFISPSVSFPAAHAFLAAVYRFTLVYIPAFLVHISTSLLSFSLLHLHNSSAFTPFHTEAISQPLIYEANVRRGRVMKFARPAGSPNNISRQIKITEQ